MTDRSEHDELAALRSLGPADTAWERPPADLWDRIAAAVAEDDASDTPDAAVPDGSVAGGTVTPLPSGPRRGSWWWVAAAAVVLVVAGAVVVRTVATDEDDGAVLARTPLEVLAGSGTGSAELLEDDAGYRLRLATDGLDDIDGYYEVWLLNEGVTGLVSLGPLRADGVYDLPAGIDPAEFPIVDVSIEPFDGDPTHSSESVLRGQLDLPS